MTRPTEAPAGSCAAPGLKLCLLSPHAAELHAHLARLDDADRLRRLGRHVDTAAIGAYCGRPRVDDTLMVGAMVDGRLVASAELTGLPELRTQADKAVAELLVAVEHDQRGKGLATRILRDVIHHATLRRVPLVQMTYAPDNVAMMRLTTRFGAIHYRMGEVMRAELCTGWLGDTLVPILIEDSPGFRPVSMH